MVQLNLNHADKLVEKIEKLFFLNYVINCFI